MSEQVKVKVKVTRTADGTVVEAECQCFGYSFRVHSSPVCPLLRSCDD